MITPISFGRTPATIQRRQRTKTGLETAESILRASQNKYGRPNSSTYIKVKTHSHKDNPRYEDITKRLNENAKKYERELFTQRYRSVGDSYFYGRVNRSLLGDCGECAQAVQNEFYWEKDEYTVNIVMDIKYNNGGHSNHVFNLSNIPKGAKADNPKTWGKEAIITDLWSGIVKRNDEAIEYLQDLFWVDKNKDKVKFYAMPDDYDSIQRAAIEHHNMFSSSY